MYVTRVEPARGCGLEKSFQQKMLVNRWESKIFFFSPRKWIYRKKSRGEGVELYVKCRVKMGQVEEKLEAIIKGDEEWG